ncbi:MAG: very short patch repair endonuclease [Nanoarchaeota archaeon]
MGDKFSKETRSRIMSKVQRNSKPEQVLRKKLFILGYRYSINYRFKELNFKPDMVLVSKKTCIFVDGCFWHRCPRCYKAPKSNKEYWLPKIERNVQRDKGQNRFLRKEGWSVIRIWEHEITADLDRVIKKILNKLEK